MAARVEAISAIPLSEHPLISPEPQRLRAVVVDDSPGYMEVICALLEMEDSVEIAGRANNGADAIQAIAHLQPDLLIMDVQMPLVNGLAAALFLSEYFPMTKIVLMSADDSPQLRTACLASGARAFIYKAKFRELFRHTLRAVFEESSALELWASMPAISCHYK